MAPCTVRLVGRGVAPHSCQALPGARSLQAELSSSSDSEALKHCDRDRDRVRRTTGGWLAQKVGNAAGLESLRCGQGLQLCWGESRAKRRKLVPSSAARTCDTVTVTVRLADGEMDAEANEAAQRPHAGTLSKLEQAIVTVFKHHEVPPA